MSLSFRLSSGPNRAARIRWQEWGPEAFAQAAQSDRPIFLVVATVWSAACRVLDETALSADAVIRILDESFVAVRIDGDRMHHVQDRYITDGWPTTCFLTPTGEVLWSATAPDTATLLRVATDVATAWRERRDEFAAEIARRRHAYEMAQRRTKTVGLVRRDTAEGVLNALRTSFDARNGGFGDAPKFPPADAVELLLALAAAGDAEAGAMAVRTLEGIRAGELIDDIDGGFYRYALEADWTKPRREKLLDVNAGMLRAYATGAAFHRREDWRETCENTVSWVERTLVRPDGLWGGSQIADARYFEGDASARGSMTAPPRDPTLYTDRAAGWISALVDAGRLLGRDEWVTRGRDALATLLPAMTGGAEIWHWHDDGQVQLSGLLCDAVALLRACLAVHRATGDAGLLDQARCVQNVLEKTFWAETGGFWDHATASPVGAVRDRQKPFGWNAEAARALLALSRASGERGPSARAERTLAVLSATAPRYGAEAAGFVMAVYTFFDSAWAGA